MNTKLLAQSNPLNISQFYSRYRVLLEITIIAINLIDYFIKITIIIDTFPHKKKTKTDLKIPISILNSFYNFLSTLNHLLQIV